MAALPLDPRLARILVEGSRLGCLREMLIIVAALAIVDVRETPLEEREKATAAHSRFVDPASDFSALLGLWVYLADQAKALSGNAFRKMCRREYLNYLRIREWQDLHAQLRQIARGLGMDTEPEKPVDPAPVADNRTPDGTKVGIKPATGGRGSLAVEVDSEKVHTALLSGLLSHIGQRNEASREYQGTRGITFMIWPGSALARSGPQLVMAAELVETSRLWGRICARIDPAWVERRQDRAVRPDRSRALARAVHPACAGRTGLDHQAPVLRPEPTGARRCRGLGGADQAPGHRGRRRDAVRVVRRADPRRGHVGTALRLLVEEGLPGNSRPDDVHHRDVDRRRFRAFRCRGVP
jgi:ATP-dependent helicase HrpA